MFSQSATDGIVSHMNEGHPDALDLYLQVFAGTKDGSDVAMSAIDANGFDIVYRADGEHCVARVDFEPPLTDASEGHSRLVSMVMVARKCLSD